MPRHDRRDAKVCGARPHRAIILHHLDAVTIAPQCDPDRPAKLTRAQHDTWAKTAAEKLSSLRYRPRAYHFHREPIRGPPQKRNVLTEWIFRFLWLTFNEINAIRDESIEIGRLPPWRRAWRRDWFRRPCVPTGRCNWPLRRDAVKECRAPVTLPFFDDRRFPPPRRDPDQDAPMTARYAFVPPEFPLPRRDAPGWAV